LGQPAKVAINTVHVCMRCGDMQLRISLPVSLLKMMMTMMTFRLWKRRSFVAALMRC